MPIKATCPKCLKKYRLNDAVAGKMARCRDCGQIFPIPLAGTEGSPTFTRFSGSPEVRRDQEPDPWGPVQAGDDQATTDDQPPEWERTDTDDDDTDDEEDEFDRVDGFDDDFGDLPEEPAVHWQPGRSVFVPSDRSVDSAAPDGGPQSPQGEPHGDEPARLPTTGRTVTLASQALEPMKMIYALQWGTVWAIGVSLAGLLGFYIHISLFPLLAVPLTWISIVGTIGGIAFLYANQVAYGTAVHWSGAWGLFGRRALSLTVGTWGIFLVVLIAAAFLFGGIFSVSHLPYIGPPIGGLLVLPTFVLVLFTVVLVLNLFLLVIVIGVEDCSATQALHLLARLIWRDWFAWLGWSILSPFLFSLGALLFAVIVMAFGLSLALALCGGEHLLTLLTTGVSLNNILHALSVSLLISAAEAFVVVFSTLQFTVLYCRLR